MSNKVKKIAIKYIKPDIENKYIQFIYMNKRKS